MMIFIILMINIIIMHNFFFFFTCFDDEIFKIFFYTGETSLMYLTTTLFSIRFPFFIHNITVACVAYYYVLDISIKYKLQGFYVHILKLEN